MTDQELSDAIREVQERARSRAPQGGLGLDGVEAADLMPLVHARDAAEAKVAAIGTVNPRPPGLLHSVAQGVKRLIARALDWHVREQVEFNRASMECVQASLEALTAIDRSIAVMAGQLAEAMEQYEKFSADQVRTLRAISELQSAYQHRLTLEVQTFRDLLAAQHRDFDAALERSTVKVQQQLSEDFARVERDFDRIRQDYERMIHTELRVLRQKVGAAAPAGPDAVVAPGANGSHAAAGPGDFHIDWTRFAERFRGSEERIRARQGRYVARFAEAECSGRVLDIGCGRGEFLDAAREAELPAYGVDLDALNVAACQAKGLKVEQADLFEHLEQTPDSTLGGAYCAQVVEHLPPSGVARLIELLGAKLRPGALATIETPNPECLAIFATHFYIDPTHTRPVPAALLHYYLEEAGFGTIEVEYLEPAVETMPELAELPESVRKKFFGALDYAVFARKL